MNQKQKEYAEKRVREIAQQKRRAIELAEPCPEKPEHPEYEGQTLDEAQAIREVNAGRLRLRPSSSLRHYGSPDLFNYLPADANLTAKGKAIKARYEAEVAAFEKASTARYQRLEKKQDALSREVTRILDELHLGDAQAAIEAIRAFEGKQTGGHYADSCETE